MLRHDGNNLRNVFSPKLQVYFIDGLKQIFVWQKLLKVVKWKVEKIRRKQLLDSKLPTKLYFEFFCIFKRNLSLFATGLGGKPTFQNFDANTYPICFK